MTAQGVAQLNGRFMTKHISGFGMGTDGNGLFILTMTTPRRWQRLPISHCKVSRRVLTDDLGGLAYKSGRIRVASFAVLDNQRVVYTPSQ